MPGSASKKPQRTARTFKEAAFRFLGEGGTSGDISIATYLLQHGLGAAPRSLAWIGAGQDAEFLALNAAVPDDANFVVLNTGGDALVRTQDKYLDLVRLLEEEHFPVRAQIVDLTLASRWPQVLSALAMAPIGVLGLNAEWALSEPQFWNNLANFWKNTPAVVYVRNMLDYERPDVCIAFLRSLPAGLEVAVIASTSGSVWLAPGGNPADMMRTILHSSGLFAQELRMNVLSDPSRPVVALGECRPELLDEAGRFPGVIFHGNSLLASGVSFGSGWSQPEADGCWTDAASTSLTLTLPEHFRTPRRLALIGNAWLWPGTTEQKLELTIGADAAPRGMMTYETGDICSMDIELTAEDTANGELVLRFDVAQPGRPSDFGGDDTRMLGFKFRSIRLFD